MKRILLFLSLRKNPYLTSIDDARSFVSDSRMHEFLYVIFNCIMLVKSQRFNTKIYIFECYSTSRTSLIAVNTLPFTHNKSILRPVLQKK